MLGFMLEELNLLTSVFSKYCSAMLEEIHYKVNARTKEAEHAGRK